MAAISIEIGSTLTRILRWWVGELSALLPDAIAHRLFGGGSRLLLDLSGPEWAVLRMSGGRQERLVPVARQEAGPEAEPAAERRRLRAIGIAGRNVELRVPGHCLLVWRLLLPMSAATDMRAAVAFQIDRKTPFAPEQTYFDYRVIRRDAATRQIEVEVAVVPRAAADPMSGRAAALGLVAHAIRADSSAGSWPRIPLPADPARGTRWNGLVWVLAVTAAILAGAAVYVPLAQRERVSLQLAQELRDAKLAAERTLQLKQNIERLQDTRAFLTARKADTPSVTGVLDALTRLLPDDVWLTQFSMSGSSAQAAGHAPAASALIGLIDGAAPFSAPRFLSAVTLDTTIGLERFNLAFTLESAP